MTIIKYDPKFEVQNSNFHQRNFIKKRENILKELCQIPGFIKAARNLKKNSLYKLVSSPEKGKLYKDSAGNLQGVFYKDSKIVQHARLKAVNPSLVKAVTAIGSQVLLISITMQLSKIEKSIERIFLEFHNDRLGEINSGIKQFDQAVLIKDSDRQERMIEHAIQTLNSAIEKTIMSLNNQIVDAPGELSFFDNWGFERKTYQAREKISLAEESFRGSIAGISALAECYSVLNEPEAAATILSQNLSRLYECDIALAAKKARIVPYNGKLLPEEPWELFLNKKREIFNEIDQCNSLTQKFSGFELEFKPYELSEGQYGKM